MKTLAIVAEIWRFLKHSKKWWMLPIVITLLILGGLLIFAQTSALAPFIYTMF